MQIATSATRCVGISQLEIVTASITAWFASRIQDGKTAADWAKNEKTKMLLTTYSKYPLPCECFGIERSSYKHSSLLLMYSTTRPGPAASAAAHAHSKFRRPQRVGGRQPRRAELHRPRLGGRHACPHTCPHALLCPRHPTAAAGGVQQQLPAQPVHGRVRDDHHAGGDRSAA
jgi:hypothetical protein